MIKSVIGGGGKGVYVIEKKDSFIFINGHKMQNKKFESFFSNLDNSIVTEFINPGKFSKSLNKDSINTMRVLTLINPKNNKPFIAAAAQRIGVKSSIPMDNFTKGGLSCLIDLDSGKLSDATSHPKNIKHIRFQVHPDSKCNFSSMSIPNWNKLKSEIINLSSNLPMLKCVGWDFLLTDDGLVALEGNHHPDPDVLQGHKSLLSEKNVVEFYKYHKII